MCHVYTLLCANTSSIRPSVHTPVATSFCVAENRGESGATGGDLSPPDIKFVPPPASTTKASPGTTNFRRPPSSASRGSGSSSPSAGLSCCTRLCVIDLNEFFTFQCCLVCWSVVAYFFRRDNHQENDNS